MAKFWEFQTFALICMFSIALLDNSAADDAVNPMRPRRCYSCEGLNCLRTSMTKVETTCTDVLDICVTVFDEFAVVAKGCYLDMPEQLRSKCDGRPNPECFKCFGELCNNVGRADFKCIECNAKDNSACASDTSKMIPTQCSIPTAPNSYCYVRQSSTGSDLKRGCLTQVEEQVNCMQDTSCSMCLSQDGEACNAYKLSNSTAGDVESGANAFLSSFSIILAMIVAHLLR